MTDIHIHRPHGLGLPKAREVAARWAEHAESRLGMQCSVLQGDQRDTVEFKRSGVDGRLHVAADHFELDAKLGFLIGAFRGTIEKEIEQNLDELLDAQPVATKPRRTAAKKAQAKKK